jgi:hypothetical protein
MKPLQRPCRRLPRCLGDVGVHELAELAAVAEWPSRVPRNL